MRKHALYWFIITYIVVIVVFYFGRFHGGISDCNSDWGDFGSYLGGMMVFVSIVLLYYTLNEQQKQSAQQIRAQHENTFFELLHYHRLLTDKVYKTYTTINDNFEPTTNSVCGRQYFEYATWTISLLQQSLSSDVYKGLFDQSSVNAQLSPIDEGASSLNTAEYLQECRITHCNSEYLPKSEWEQLHIQSNREVAAYSVFSNKQLDTYDTYIRRIKQLLHYLAEHKDLAAVEYAKYMQMQMTRNELKFLDLHATIDDELKTLLDHTLLTRLSTEA